MDKKGALQGPERFPTPATISATNKNGDRRIASVISVRTLIIEL
jgi:hypothetical protein